MCQNNGFNRDGVSLQRPLYQKTNQTNPPFPLCHFASARQEFGCYMKFRHLLLLQPEQRSRALAVFSSVS